MNCLSMIMKYWLLLLLLFLPLIGCVKDTPTEQPIILQEQYPAEELKDFENITFTPFNIFSTRKVENNILYDAITPDFTVETNYKELFLELTTWMGFVNDNNVKKNCSSENNIYRCLYYYTIQNARTDYCLIFPEDALVEECRPYGCINITVNYKDLCKTRAILMEPFVQSENKTAYCAHFLDDRIKNLCNSYNRRIS